MKIAMMIGSIYGTGGRIRVLSNLSKILSDIGVDMHIICRQTAAGGTLPYHFDERVTIHHLNLMEMCVTKDGLQIFLTDAA